MSRQTPAPWGYTYDGSGTYSIGPAADPQSAPIAVIYDHDDERATANARLIAAAPDLLAAAMLGMAALERVHHSTDDDRHAAADALRLAVARAAGAA